MNIRHAMPITLILLILAPAPPASAADQPADISATTLAKRVGQVLAGYDDFWVWIRQSEYSPEGAFRGEMLGRAYFKQRNKFRLNFGQPPELIHGTDGSDYWIFERGTDFVRVGDPEENPTEVHLLVWVFAAGGRMARALDRFFDVDALVKTEFEVRDREDNVETVEGYRLVITPKPDDDDRAPPDDQVDEELEELRPELTYEQLWTFWVDKDTFIPRKIQIDWKGHSRQVYELDQFHSNTGLSDRIFRCPPGLRRVPLDD